MVRRPGAESGVLLVSARRVVVTGLGVISPLGHDHDEVFERLCRGDNGISRIDHFSVEHCAAKVGGIVRDFDPASVIGDREGRRLLRLANRIQAFGLCAAVSALKDAAVSRADVDPDRLGVFLGAGRGGAEVMERWMNRARSMDPTLLLEADRADLVHRLTMSGNPVDYLQQCPCLVTAMVSICSGARGPCSTNVNLCSAGAQAIADAAHAIQRGDADVMIAGGTDSMLNPADLSAFCALEAVSPYPDPEVASRPFDLRRDGCVVGEGAAVLILEELGHAIARGATIRAELRGQGCSSDAHKLSAAPDDGAGAVLSMRNALRSARLDPPGVDHVNAHGTATLLNDRVETQAIKTVLGKRAREIPIVSTKSMTGHLIAAAGAFEALVAVKTLERRKVHPTRNLKHPDPRCDLDYVPGEARELPHLRTVMSNSFAIGGTNATLIFSRLE